ncbi:peptidase A8 [Stenotrophomonas humi]|uniref:Lipoprotein signal peptidase n=1 Tax=Stenotrophomonas humi TaxID=405444 RepID=A0A0R0CDI9_9GAMM|nr:signal peptidase II [Stenotrophomonas humi]KRG63443.1 peptidase A8 [Stenotrophomonas humi]
MQAKAVKPNALIYLLVSVAVIGLDQWSKAWVLSSLPEFQAVKLPIRFLGEYWNWYRTYNTGAAFSFLSDAGGWQLWFFTFLAIAISGLMAFWLSRTPRANWRTALPYALVIGGAIGNVIDRQIHGHVVDFIQWHIGDYNWPSFNIADSAIVVGAIGIALMGLLDGKAEKKAG